MATIAPECVLRRAGVSALALVLSACGDSDVAETCKTRIDAAATALALHEAVFACVKNGVADDPVRDDLKLRSETLLKDGKVGAFVSAMPPNPDVVEGVQGNVRRYSIRSLIQVPNTRPRVLHFGFEFTGVNVSGIVFDLNERQESEAKSETAQPEAKPSGARK